jgi:hypothetical protein
MIKRNTWILLFIFLGLVAVMLLLQKTNLLAPEATLTATSKPALISQDDPITGITLAENNGMTISVELGLDSQWSIQTPAGLQVDQGDIQNVLSDFYGISVQSSLSSSFSLEATGLDSPTYTFTLTFRSGETRILKIGLLTPTRSGYYVKLDGTDPVIILQSNIDNAVELLEKVTYTPTPEVTDTSSEVTDTPEATISLTLAPTMGTPTP